MSSGVGGELGKNVHATPSEASASFAPGWMPSTRSARSGFDAGAMARTHSTCAARFHEARPRKRGSQATAAGVRAGESWYASALRKQNGTRAMSPPQRSSKLTPMFALRIVVALGILVLAYFAYSSGILGLFANPGAVRTTLLDLGARGYLVFLAAFTFLQPIGCPGIVFLVGAALVWPPHVAITLSLIGSVMASIVGFSVSRFLARDWVERRLPARFRAYDEKLAQRAFRTIFVLRVIFLMNPFLHGFFGISRVSFLTHLVASTLGYLPTIIVVTYVGGSAVTWLTAFLTELSSTTVVSIVIVLALLLVAAGFVRRKIKQTRAARGELPPVAEHDG